MLEFMLLATFTCVNIQFKTVEDLHKTDSKTYVFEISTYIWYFGFNICVLLAGRILQIVIVTESFL